MKRLGEKIEALASMIVLVLGILLFAFCTYYSLRYSQGTKFDLGVILIEHDSPVANLFILAVLLLVFFLLKILFMKSPDQAARFMKFFLPACLLYTLLVSILWVHAAHGQPYADQAAVYVMASCFMEGNFTPMEPAGYMFLYSQQYGIVFVLEFLFRIFGANQYVVFQYLNALCIPFLAYAGYRIVRLLTDNWEAAFYYLLLLCMCVPLFLYVPFVYGEIISITFSLALIWQVIRLCKQNRLSALLWGTLFAGISTFVRMNSLIVVIACGLVLLVHTCRSLNPRCLIMIGTMALAIISFDFGVKTFYEQRSDIKIEGGIPRILHIAMGLQDTYWGPGWYNNYVKDAFWECEFERDTSKGVGRSFIRNKFSEFASTPGSAVDFFKRKVLSQWNEPTYNSLMLTCSFDCADNELPEVTHSIYYGRGHAFLTSFMDRYQFVLYFCALFCLFAICRRRPPIYVQLLLVAIIGGFLFSILWEAKSRYILPYMVITLPLSAMGIHELHEAAGHLLLRMKALLARRKE